MWVTSRAGSVGWDLRKVSELSSCLGRRRLTFGARRSQASGLAVDVARGGGGGWGRGRWKSRHRKIVPLSSLCRKTFNSKVIKSFVLELRSVLCFGIPMLSIYTSYEHSMYIANIRIMGMLQYHWFLSTRIASPLNNPKPYISLNITIPNWYFHFGLVWFYGISAKFNTRSILCRSSALKPHHQMQYSILPRTHLFRRELLLRRGYSQLVLSLDQILWIKNT